jgi:hypothetical protein
MLRFRWRTPRYFGGSALASARRFQAAKVDDKKFHCAICFKAFRLEMAAQLHLKQAHNGVGSISAGPGPGAPAAGAAIPVATPSFNAREAHREEEEYRPIRKQRPTPQPLNKSVLEMPPGAMEAMLGVWDNIGSLRIAGFLPSTAIAKVFAARPADLETPAPTYQSVLAPEGPNPFETATPAPETASAAAETVVIHASCPFSTSTNSATSPFRPRAVLNPFLTASKQQLPGPQAPRKVDPAAQVNLDTVDGQAARGTVVAAMSPFAAASHAVLPTSAGQAVSPFAASAAPSFSVPGTSPFATAGQTASPFAVAGQMASPFAATEHAASPFAAAGQAISPFASAGQPASVFASPGHAASPFAAAGQTASPFASGSVPPPFAAGLDAHAAPPFSAPAPGTVSVARLPCPKCDKTFADQRGLSDHAKAKHNLELPRGVASSRRSEAMEIPPYVPSPVDMNNTVPYGNVAAQPLSSSWSEVELFPHTLAVSNMDVLGELLAVQRAGVDRPTAVLTLRIDGDDDRGEELTIKIFGALADYAMEHLAIGNTVAATGVLRLNPKYDAVSNRYYCYPALHVAPAVGHVHRVG